MEAELMSILDDIANREDVKGVLLVDDLGLCLGARGIAKANAAAVAHAIATTARDLLDPIAEAPDKPEYPTINIEYENCKVVIQSRATFTLAIFM